MKSSNKLSYYLEELSATTDQASYHGLPASHKALRLAYAAQGIVGNGGFRYFYELRDDPSDVAWAFRHIGLPEAAAVEESMRPFPAGMLEGRPRMLDAHWTERITWMDTHRKELEISWDKTERVIMDLSNKSTQDPGDILETCTRKFILQHLDEFVFKE